MSSFMGSKQLGIGQNLVLTTVRAWGDIDKIRYQRTKDLGSLNPKSFIALISYKNNKLLTKEWHISDKSSIGDSFEP